MSETVTVSPTSRSAAGADSNEPPTVVNTEATKGVPVVDKLKPQKSPIHAKGLEEARCSAGLYLVWTVFAKAAQDEYGLIPLDGHWWPNLAPDLTNDASHASCTYCHCQCAGTPIEQVTKRMDGHVTERKGEKRRSRCDHCRFYRESNPRRCLGAIGDRSGSIAYILRHSSLHRPPKTKPVDEALISAVTIAFQMNPVSADPRRFLARPSLVVPHLSALWGPYQEWQHHLATCGDDEKASMVDWFAAREARDFMIMAFTSGANAWEYMLRKSDLRCRCSAPPRDGPPHHPNCDFTVAAGRHDSC